jgi:drug/metabolite transporter (DMT)-like permease
MNALIPGGHASLQDSYAWGLLLTIVALVALAGIAVLAVVRKIGSISKWNWTRVSVCCILALVLGLWLLLAPELPADSEPAACICHDKPAPAVTIGGGEASPPQPAAAEISGK